MNLREMSDEELVDDVNDYDQYNDDKIQELKDRLARGRKAIKALERIAHSANRPLNRGHFCDYRVAIEAVKQQIKEATDDRG